LIGLPLLAGPWVGSRGALVGQLVAFPLVSAFWALASRRMPPLTGIDPALFD
jgi:hypothetical protein